MAAPRPKRKSLPLQKVFQLRCCLIYAACLWGVPWRSFSSLAPESRQPPEWWRQGWARQRAGSVAEAELLAPLGELLMPGVPVTELFRSFKSPTDWGGHYLEPDLTAYGVLKDKTAALFVEYDGYWRHGTKEGMANDHMKHAALLGFSPPGSYVVRISHENKSQLEENVLWVTVNTWRPGDRTSFTRTLENVLKEAVPRLQHALNPGVCKRFQAYLSDKRLFVISRSAREYRESALVQRGGNTTEEIQNFLSAEGFGQADIDLLHKQALICGPSIETTLQPLLQLLSRSGLTQGQVAKAVATFPQILGLSIEQNLKPTVHWFLDLGLTKSQFAKVVATFPRILGCSIEQNLKPTVKWFLDLGLTKNQIAKAVASFPQIFGLSIEQNLKPTVQWLLDLGLTKRQVVKSVATFPRVLGYSIEQNLKPTVQWLLDLGLTKRQVAKSVATFPQILSFSTEQKLKSTVQWLLDLGLTRRQIAKAIAVFPQLLNLSKVNLACKVRVLQSCLTVRDTARLIALWPVILGYSPQRLKDRLHVLSGQGCSEKLRSAMRLTKEAFRKRFLAKGMHSAVLAPDWGQLAIAWQPISIS